MFEFNPELVEGDDAEADESAFQREPHDDDDVRTFLQLSHCFVMSNNNIRNFGQSLMWVRLTL